MKTLITFLFIPMLMLVSCSPDSSVDIGGIGWFPGHPDSIEGAFSFTVVDDISETPIVGASLYVEYLTLDNNESEAKTLTTFDSGIAYIFNVKDLTYIEVSAEGYITKIFSDGNYDNPIRLVPIDD